MITKLSIQNYRSILNLNIRLKRLNVVTGANGSGKSNLYKALRLLAETAKGGVINSIASEGGLNSTYWAGPAKLTSAMIKGEVPVQGGPMKGPKRLKLGFTDEQFGYSISLGLPPRGSDNSVDNLPSAFCFDPEIKHECIWAGNLYKPSKTLIARKGPSLKNRRDNGWDVITNQMNSFSSMFDQLADPTSAPETYLMREQIRDWRFYDHFRTDSNAPARQIQLGTRTPVLHHDGRDLAAALQTIIEIGDHVALANTISDAFPGCKLEVDHQNNGRFQIQFYQYGLLRPLSGAELSDGMLRYILWVAALLTPRPPSLMILNEPETSLHPDLIPPLARLIQKASENSQIWVISHNQRLVRLLSSSEECQSIVLEKQLGQTIVKDQGLLNKPAWNWPD